MPESKSTKGARRFVIEPVETTTISRRSAKKDPAGNGVPKDDKPAVRRFLPQPVETTTKHSSNRSKAQVSRDSDSDEERQALPSSRNKAQSQKQYTPQLIETAKRSRKTGDRATALQQQDKTDNSPGDRTYQPRRVRLPTIPQSDVPATEKAPWNGDDIEVVEPPESRFSFASLSAKPDNRRRSFRVPTLESITSAGDSDGSEDGDFISPPSTTPSAISEEPERHEKHEKMTKLRKIHTESHDESDGKLPNYFLALASTVERQQLQEQALAAFPNERLYQSVNHFAIEDEDDAEDRRRSAYLRDDPDFYQRRLSATAWDLQEMQRHKEMREEERKQQKLHDDTPVKRKKSEFDPWHNPYDFSAIQALGKDARSNAGFSAEDAGEHTKMRNAASPPMLGGDLLFLKTVSPQHTMMDPTQRPKARKYDRHDGLRSRQNSGLWTPHSHSPVLSRKNSDIHKRASPGPPSAGLWGGFCQNPEHHSTTESTCITAKKSQTGVNTPFRERANPLSPAPSPISFTPCHQLPITPPPGSDKGDHLEGLSTKLQLEATLDEEYPDSFVTQVYNYLSLGYPALARDYDEELSKISRVSVEEIRRGDDSSDSRGHIGAPEAQGWDEKRVMEQCGRWSALKSYIHEWARQQPKFRDESKNARGRRGSWGV